MDDPGAVVKLGQGVCERSLVNDITERLLILQGGIDLGCQNITGELAPVCGGNEFGVRRKKQKLVELSGGGLVITRAEVGLAVKVERVDQIDSNVVFFKKAQVLDLVSLKIGLNLRVLKGIGNGG